MAGLNTRVRTASLVECRRVSRQERMPVGGGRQLCACWVAASSDPRRSRESVTDLEVSTWAREIQPAEALSNTIRCVVLEKRLLQRSDNHLKVVCPAGELSTNRAPRNGSRGTDSQTRRTGQGNRCVRNPYRLLQRWTQHLPSRSKRPHDRTCRRLRRLRPSTRPVTHR